MQAKIRCAVVTGGNKGIGFEICRQLACSGISVVLTSRDISRGLEAVEKLKNSFGLSNVVFHHLDLVNPITLPSLADFIRSHFGKLDILVNNAGILGATTDAAGFTTMVQALVRYIYNKKALEILDDGDSLTEERVDEIVNIFFKDFREDLLETKGWPSCLPAYTISKICAEKVLSLVLVPDDGPSGLYFTNGEVTPF
ncbi:hypothetical protein C5167_048463 [Papaver somniferum]|uniref:Uncharacterized protein n=1 Tax=Papaver somniferum TaxID=3469 RepID=A0A4Y7KI15_PAPSO|nr:hypothetical protein C5167_048463 [Papaver somniferum]